MKYLKVIVSCALMVGGCNAYYQKGSPKTSAQHTEQSGLKKSEIGATHSVKDLRIVDQGQVKSPKAFRSRSPKAESRGQTQRLHERLGVSLKGENVEDPGWQHLSNIMAKQEERAARKTQEPSVTDLRNLFKEEKPHTRMIELEPKNLPNLFYEPSAVEQELLNQARQPRNVSSSAGRFKDFRNYQLEQQESMRQASKDLNAYEEHQKKLAKYRFEDPTNIDKRQMAEVELLERSNWNTVLPSKQESSLLQKPMEWLQWASDTVTGRDSNLRKQQETNKIEQQLWILKNATPEPLHHSFTLPSDVQQLINNRTMQGDKNKPNSQEMIPL